LIIVSLEKYEEKNIFGSPTTGFKIPFFGPSVKDKDIVVFSRQIATLFESGISALRSFRLVETETENPELKKILNHISDDIQSGVSISAAISKYNHIFSSFYSNMVKAGEESGKLNQSFAYLADYIERNFEIAQKIKKASIYPIFVIVVFIAVMMIMVVFVIPQLAGMLSSQGQDLPLITKIIFSLGIFLKKYGVYLFIVFIGGFYYVYNLSQTRSGKEYVDLFKMKIPIFNIFFKHVFISRLVDNLHTMLTAGVSMVRSLEITGDVIDNAIFKDTVARILIKVRSGKALSQAFYEEEDIPNIVVQMTRIGEETGNIGFMLKSLSAYYRREVETNIDTILAFIQPSLIIMLAGGVGILLSAVLIPMYASVTNI